MKMNTAAPGRSGTPLSVAVIGAGPAGLTAAYLLTARGIPVTVLEADPQYLGGISRTVVHDGFRIDIGGHRFFSRIPDVLSLWRDWLGEDLLERSRSSRIYYRGRFFKYPLRASDALAKLGAPEAIRCVLSYARARVAPIPCPANFEQWVTNRFGRRLFEIFFQAYTEKVWGMSCTDVSADWAAQRIGGLSLGSAITEACRPPWSRSNGAKTLTQTFWYPRRGPGMMWDACAERIRTGGGVILQGRRVVGCSLADGSWSVSHVGDDGAADSLRATHVISSAPLCDLIAALAPRVPSPAREAAAGLGYRDFLIVALILADRGRVSDQWIYVHDPTVKVARVQNFKAWSPEMAPPGPMCCYGLEYFCSPGDALASQSDDSLVALATDEIVRIGLAGRADVTGGVVIRQSKAYPIYDDGYAERVRCIRETLEDRFPTLHPVGRNGMHRYDNQDRAMVTAMLTVENICAGRRLYDVWRVTNDAEYLEEGLADRHLSVLGVPGPVSGSASRLMPRPRALDPWS